MENIETPHALKARIPERMYYWPSQHALVFHHPAFGFILVNIGALKDGQPVELCGHRLQEVAPLPDHITESLGEIMGHMPYYENTFTAQVHGMVELPVQHEMVDIALKAIEAAAAAQAAAPAKAPTTKSGK